MRARFITILAALLALSVIAPASATESPAVLTDYRITSWSGGDGVTLGPVTAIVQDRDGYLWLASGAGLVRFDGFRFATSDIVFGATKLPAAPTRTVYLAHDGSLWVGYGDGHGIYQIVNGEVNAVHLKGVFTGFVRAITEDRSGALWVGYDEGLYRFVNNRWDRVLMPLEGLDRRVFDIHEDRAGTLWIATAAGLYRRAADGTFKKGDDADANVFAISEDASGALWITDDASGVRRVGVRHSKHLVDGRGYGLLNDSRGNMWVATTAQGLWQVRTGTDGSAESVKQVTVQTGLLADEVSDFLEDRDGNIWVGAIRGISRLTPHKVQSLVDVGVVNALTADPKGTVWAGTTTGIVALAVSSARPAGRTVIGADSVRTLHRDAAGTIWAATREGLHRIVKGRLVPVPVEGGAPTRITSIASDRSGAVWLSDEADGVLRLVGNHLERVTTLTDGISARPIFLYADGMDQIWVAFDGGILRMRSSDGSRVQQYGQSDGLLDTTINAIHADRRGDLWIGGNRGLSRLHGNRFETLTDHNGLPPRAVTSVIDDDHGNLWLTYRYFGFVRVARDEIDRAISDPAHRVRYESYSMSDGIAGAPDLLNGDIAAKSADGRLWFVTGRGLTIFDPAEHRTETDSEPSVPRIEGVTADDHRYRTAVGTALPPRTGRLRIDYTVVNLASLDKISFRYRLDGVDKDWVDGTSPRQAYYTNLPPGQYRFRLQAAHDTQTWTDAEADWSFRIEPMFYETRWFYAASIFAVGLLAVGIWRVRIRQVRKQLALVYNERIRLSRDIHDTLLQSLYGVALQLDAAPRDPSQPSALRTHLQRIRRQIDDHISEARQAIWDLRSPALNRHDLAGALRDSGEALTAGKVSFNLTVTGTPRRYSAKLETHVLRIGHEAIMNAVRHAGARRVDMELAFTDSGLSLRVTDDGRGFDVNQHFGSAHDPHCGLMTMKERAADVGGRCVIQSKPGSGAQVVAEFPLAPVA